MSTNQDQARLVAERVARRVAGTRGGVSISSSSNAGVKNGAPVRAELSALREGLHDLENKLDQIESKIVQGALQPPEHTRARVIDFVASAPPVVAAPSIASQPQVSERTLRGSEKHSDFVPPTQSPWLAPMARMYGGAAHETEKEIPQSEIRDSQLPSHPSEERFGIEEATVTELVEFFENEKKCSVDPGGRPCDHCAMCSSRGF